MPFTGGKLFAFTTNSNILATVGGLCIDANCNVVGMDDKPIPGLFACGNASGSFFAGTIRATFLVRASGALSPSDSLQQKAHEHLLAAPQDGLALCGAICMFGVSSVRRFRHFSTRFVMLFRQVDNDDVRAALQTIIFVPK